MKAFKYIMQALIFIVFIAATYLCGVYSTKYKQNQEDNKSTITTVAVVNADQGVMVDGELTNYASDLIAFPDINFTTVSLNEAQEGVAEGRYAAYILIPTTFSQSIVSINGEPKKAEVTYEISANLREDAKIKVVNDVHNFLLNLNTNISYVYVDAILEEVHAVQDGSVTVMKNDTADMEAIVSVEESDLIEDIAFDPLKIPETEIEYMDLSDDYEEVNTAVEDIYTTYQENMEDAETEFLTIKEDEELINTEALAVGEILVQVDILTDAEGNLVYQEGEENLSTLTSNFAENAERKKLEAKIVLGYDAVLPTPTPIITASPSPTSAPTTTPTPTGSQPLPTATIAPTMVPASKLDHIYEQIDGLIAELNEMQGEEDDTIQGNTGVSTRNVSKATTAKMRTVPSKNFNEKTQDGIWLLNTSALTSEEDEKEEKNEDEIIEEEIVEEEIVKDETSTDQITEDVLTEDENLNKEVPEKEIQDSTKDEETNEETSEEEDKNANDEKQEPGVPTDNNTATMSMRSRAYSLTGEEPNEDEELSEADIQSLITNLEDLKSDIEEYYESALAAVDAIPNVTEIQSEVQTIIQDEISQPIMDECTSEAETVTTAVSGLEETITEYLTKLEEYDAISYVEKETIDEYMTSLYETIGDMETEIMTQDNLYLTYIGDLETTADENITSLQDNLDTAYTQTKFNIDSAVAVLKANRGTLNQQNIEVLEGITQKLPYTRLGNLEYRQAYDFIVEPIEGKNASGEDIYVSKTAVTLELNDLIYVFIGIIALMVIYVSVLLIHKRYKKQAGKEDEEWLTD